MALVDGDGQMNDGTNSLVNDYVITGSNPLDAHNYRSQNEWKELFPVIQRLSDDDYEDSCSSSNKQNHDNNGNNDDSIIVIDDDDDEEEMDEDCIMLN